MKKVIFTSVLFCFVAFSASAQKQKTEELRKKQAATPPSTAKLAVNANKTKPTDPASSFSDAVSKMPQQTNNASANSNNASTNSKTGTTGTAPKIAADTKAKKN